MSRARWWIASLALLIALVAGAPARSAAARCDTNEYELKAAFVFNFLRYFTWPPEAFAKSDTPYSVAVLGADSFARILEDAVAGRTVNGRAVEVRRVKTVDALLTQCHLAFVPAAEERSVATIRERLRAKPVVLVGESKGFAEAVDGLGFFLEDRRVRFEIALDGVKARKLEASSQILKLARVLRAPARGD